MSTSTSTIAPRTPTRPTDQVRASVTGTQPAGAGRAPVAMDEQDADDVEPQVGRVLVVRRQPALSQQAQPLLLDPCHGLDRVTEPGAAPRLHLAEDQRGALPADDVELALRHRQFRSRTRTPARVR